MTASTVANTILLSIAGAAVVHDPDHAAGERCADTPEETTARRRHERPGWHRTGR